MADTRRVSVNVTSPSTQFNTYADLVSQSPSGNSSLVHYWVQAINKGDGSSHINDSGSQKAKIGGYGGSGHTGNLPSGYAYNAERWYDGPYSATLPHNSAGNRGADVVAQTISWWSRTDNGTIGPYPRIPKPPTKPGTPVASNVLPSSLTLTWAASSDNGGSAINSYLVRRWTGPTMTGSYVDVSNTNTLTRNVPDLTPGTTYTFGIYAHNSSYGGYSPVSTGITVKTVAPMHVKVDGIWYYAVPYVKISGIWKAAQPYVKIDGLWCVTA